MATTISAGHGAAERGGPCGCGGGCGGRCGEGATAGLERTRFFAHQLVTPDDFTQDQIYFREKLRRHNRMLHGWGVVCGACVRRGAGPCEVIVEPGYVLGPYGDEIVIAAPVTIDVCKQRLGERDGCCGEELDPWCADVRADCPDGRLFLAVRYSECQARPVRALTSPCGCGCDDTACEYSRVRDSFALKLLAKLPSTYADPLVPPNEAVLRPCDPNRTARRCPPCPDEPWVILADVLVGRDCAVRTVDCFAHRRYVVTFADFFQICAGQAGAGGAAQPGVGFPGSMFMSATTGTAALIDVQAAAAGGAPSATVTMRRSDGTSVAVPAHFSVRAGDTVADLLEREGRREYFDPATGDTVTLRALFERSGAASDARVTDARVTGAASALAPLEGRVLRASPPAPGRGELEGLLDRDGLARLDRELGGAVDRAGDLPASALTEVGPGTVLAAAVDAMMIADVAALERDAFVARATEGAPRNERREARRQAAELWAAAQRVVQLRGKE